MKQPDHFQAMPDARELAALQRDLRFHPSQNAHPTRLDPASIVEFNRKGFLKGLPVFNEPEILELRGYFDELLEKTLRSGQDSYSISSAHLRHGRVYDLLKDPRMVDYVKDLLGEHVIGWGSHFFCKMPGDGKPVAWHQDASYWPLTPSKAITVWLAIDDADTENACMRFIEGSHWKGHLTYRPSSDDENNVLNQTIDNPEQYGQVINDDLKAGHVSVHADLLLHGSEANQSSRRRCGLTLRYCTPDVRAGCDWNQKGVWVSGNDPSGHWANRPRPEQE